MFTDASYTEAVTTEVSDKYDPCTDAKPMPLSLKELNDLTRDLNLSKESDQLLGSRLREKNLLAPGTTFYWYRDREAEFRVFFTFDELRPLVF